MKKVLSFVLSVAMVICLMPSLAFAADDAAASSTTATATGLSQFSDADSITDQNKGAVATLVGLGIIDGMGDGTFQPQGDLTRAQASKLVATLVKSGDKSDIPAPAADPFTDVAKSYWGAGAIQFGVDNGYINGMGDGTFHPEDKVTTAQLATMLVKLLGISSVDANYQWPENVMAWSSLFDLFYDVSQKGANDILNRENAAQMIYNALLETTRVKATTTGSDTQSVDGRSNYERAINSKFDFLNRPLVDPDEDPDGDIWMQLIEKYFPKVTCGTAKSDDPFNRPVTVWKNGKEKITDEIVEEPILVYTAQEVSSKDSTKANDKLKDDLDGYTAKAEIYYNGAYLGDGARIITNDSDVIANRISQLTGNGRLVEVYSDDRDIQIDRIVIADYDLAVANPDSKEKTIKLYKNKSFEDKDKIGEVNSKKTFYSKISSAAKKDFVLVAVKGTEIIDAYLPESVDDVAVTRKLDPSEDDNKIKLQDAKAVIGDVEYIYNEDGVQEYDASGKLILDKDKKPILEVAANDKGTAFTDQYGYLVAYNKAKETAADWALLVSLFTKESTNDVGETSEDWNAIIVKEDGSVESIPVLYDSTSARTSDDNDADTYDIVVAFKTATGTVKNGNNYSNVSGKLVTYDETADGYKFKDKDNKSEAHTATGPVESKATKIGANYISSALSVVKVSMTDNKASKLKVTTTDKPTVKAGEVYKYVTKESGNNNLVTTMYRTGDAASDKTLIRVTADKGEGAYGSAQKTGRIIEYYTDGSTDVQEIVVSNKTEVAKGWYAVKEIKEGMELKVMTETEKTNEKVVDYTVVPGTKADTGYGDSITLGGTQYEVAADAEIIDLADKDIDSTEALIDEIARVGDDSGAEALKLAFAYTNDDDKNKVSRVYILKTEKKVSEAKPETTDDQNQSGTADDQTQQGDNQQTGDNTQQGDNQQTGDNTQQGDNQQTGDDTQQGGGGTVAG